MSSLNPASNGLRRHALVWLKQAPQPDLEQDAPDVDRWQQRGNPFVVSRQRGEPHRLSLGFCEASHVNEGHRPRRISVQGRYEDILRMERPPSLAEVAALNPTGPMADSLARLSKTALEAGLKIHVFGSWMWQMLSGDPHVNGSSDLDVLIDVATEVEADRAAAFLWRAASEYPLKIDGELSLPGRGEVHWREYFDNVPEILVKSITTARIIRREELWK